VVVAWWTLSEGSSVVRIAFSKDAGDRFEKPVRADFGKAEGQVTVVLLPGGNSALVGWLEDGKTWARTVSADGKLGAPISLGKSPPHSRLPRWVSEDGGVFAAWTSQESGIRSVRVAHLRF